MKNITHQFCRIYTRFFREEISTPNQVEIRLSGNKLKDFCDFYFEERLGESSLKHFFSKKKRFYIVFGVFIGFTISIGVYFLFNY